MDKLKILIADSTEDFRCALVETLRGAYHVRTAGEGMQALQLVRSFLPDVLILDLMMPGLDGITLIQRAAECGIRPMVLATTRYVSDYILESATKLGIGYIMVKPCSVSAVIARVADLSEKIKVPIFTHPDPRTLVSNTLLRLGISTKLRGYGYLREAVLLMAQDPQQSITKEMYPAVAAQFNATAIQIERSIRSAIHTAWQQMDAQVWVSYFPANDVGLIPRPTNAAFISRLADMLILNADGAAEE